MGIWTQINRDLSNVLYHSLIELPLKQIVTFSHVFWLQNDAVSCHHCLPWNPFRSSLKIFSKHQANWHTLERCKHHDSFQKRWNEKAITDSLWDNITFFLWRKLWCQYLTLDENKAKPGILVIALQGETILSRMDFNFCKMPAVTLRTTA